MKDRILILSMSIVLVLIFILADLIFNFRHQVPKNVVDTLTEKKG